MTRTTISLHESTLNKVKEMSRKEHRSLGETITELLNLGFEKKSAIRQLRSKPFHLKSYAMGRPTVALEDKEALYAILDRKNR